MTVDQNLFRQIFIIWKNINLYFINLPRMYISINIKKFEDRSCTFLSNMLIVFVCTAQSSFNPMKSGKTYHRYTLFTLFRLFTETFRSSVSLCSLPRPPGSSSPVHQTYQVKITALFVAIIAKWSFPY